MALISLPDLDATTAVLPAGATLQPGDLVYVHPAGTLFLSRADLFPQALTFGMSVGTALAGQDVSVVTHGKVTLSDWTSVTGSASLTPAARYYLATAPGDMSTTPPAQGSGDYLVRVGTALSAQDFHLEKYPVILRGA